MVTKLKEVDAVMVGMGLTGGILAKELTMAGLNVVGLERGPDRRPQEEFTLPRIRDELKYNARMELMIDKNIRHLPVYDSGELAGLLSVRDVLKEVVEVQQIMLSQLERYITGGGR